MTSAFALILAIAASTPAPAQVRQGDPAETPERRPGEGEQSDARKVHYGKAPPPAKAAPRAAGACAADDDCALTSVAPGRGECCATLCTPRAVTRRRAGDLARRTARCSAGTCPHPVCAPPLRRLAAACEARRCVARPQPAVDQ